MKFVDPFMCLLFPGQRLGASVTCPLHSGDDQCHSLHDHCEWKGMHYWALAAQGVSQAFICFWSSSTEVPTPLFNTLHTFNTCYSNAGRIPREAHAQTNPFPETVNSSKEIKRRLMLSLIHRWFCLPWGIFSSPCFSIAGWPNMLWRTW